MNIQHKDIEQKLAGIVSSIGKNPESWQNWMCLQINLQNEYDDDLFGRAIVRIHDFLSAYLKDIEVDVFSCRNRNVHIFCKHVAKGIERAIPCLRIGVTVIGLEVPHCHVHLIPINSMDDMNFSRPKLSLSSDELSNTAENIRTAIMEI